MTNKENIKISEVAFDFKERGYRFKATYLEKPKGEALIEISRIISDSEGELIKEFLFPSYKIWNIAAHMDDIIDGLERRSDDGLYIAGSNGIGGNAYNV